MPELKSPAPAPGEVASVALALVNTEVEPRGEPVDLLPNGRALAAWLRERGLTGRRGVAVADEDLEHMRCLRTAIRAAFLARSSGRRPPPSAMAMINQTAARVASTTQLRWAASGPAQEAVWAEAASTVEVAFAKLAVSAICTLVGDGADRLRLCGAHGCNRMFIAEHRGRRWCSRTCGDRVRVARHLRKRTRSA